MNYSVCTAIFACTDPCDTNTFIDSLTRMSSISTENSYYPNEAFFKSKKNSIYA